MVTLTDNQGVPLTKKALANLKKYLASDHCKQMDIAWANRFKTRCSAYDGCLDLQIRNQVDYFDVKKIP